MSTESSKGLKTGGASAHMSSTHGDLGQAGKGLLLMRLVEFNEMKVPETIASQKGFENGSFPFLVRALGVQGSLRV